MFLFEDYIPGIWMVKIFHLVKIVFDMAIKAWLREPLGWRNEFGGRHKRKRVNATE